MDNEMIDISSVSEDFKEEPKIPDTKTEEKKQKIKKSIKNIKIPLIKKTGFKSLGNIIKVISFVVSLAILAAFVLGAYVLFAFKPLYLTICIAIVVFGLIVALISLFMIYAIGHIINQNNEIISNLTKDQENQ
ncbi:MAG: hypothetical protein IKK24_06960 [Clostridia bacterium]|nr:hypothetical protein [Clostridia bacterium]